MPNDLELEAALEAALESDSDTNSQSSQDGSSPVKVNYKPAKGPPTNKHVDVLRKADGESGLAGITFVDIDNTVVPTVVDKDGVYTEVTPAEVIKRTRLYLQKAGRPHTDEDILKSDDAAFTHAGKPLFLTKKVVAALNATIKRKQKKEEEAGEKVKKPKAKPVKHDTDDEEKTSKKARTEGGVKPEEESDEDGDVLKSRASPKPDFEQPELQRELTSDDIVLTLRLPRSFIENGLKRPAASGH